MDYTKKIEKENSAEKKIDIYKYNDVEGGMTTKQLDIGLWTVKHQDFFKKTLIAALIIVSSISWAFTIYGVAAYVFVGIEKDKNQMIEMVNTSVISHDYLVKLSPQNIAVSEIQLFPLGDDKYDLAIEVSNPNFRYWADMEYCFVTDAEKIICGQDFIMPGDRKYIIKLANTISSGSDSVKFIVNNLAWKRINLHEYPDWKNFSDNHLNIPISGVKFDNTVQSGLTEKIGYNNLGFMIDNKTAYNYWQVDFNILLWQNERLVSVNKYNLQRLMSGGRKEINISWPGKLSNISNIEIKPDLNILDQNNYINFEGGAGLEK